MELPTLTTRQRSLLFTIRLWQETGGQAAGEARMQVKQVLSGETYCFREWTQLVQYLEDKLQERDEG